MINNIEEITYYLYNKEKYTTSELPKVKTIKLLYYTQGLYVAQYNKPFFAARIEAWKYGPVVPYVYHNWERIVNEIKKENFTETDKRFLDKILNTFKNWSPWDMIVQTHMEDPWIESIREKNSEITLKQLQKFFKKKLSNE